MNREDMLLSVEKPSRYTGGEVNAVRKDRQACRLSVALAFPDTYEVGMSHLGIQILYAILNAHPQVLAERCFAPWPDMEAQMRRHGVALASLESHTPLRDFDIVGFSLQYELSYTNVLNMLELGGIPRRAAERGDSHPLIIAGGPCAFHPAPMARFIDAFAIGEGEEVISEIAAAVMQDKLHGRGRRDRLQRLAGIAGVYVPSVHTAGDRIKKRSVADLNAWPLPLKPVVPLMQTIHHRATLEIARGCTRGCRFCQAGMVWRPVRERRPEGIEGMAETMLCATGYGELSLLSLSAGDYSRIEPLLASLMDRYSRRRVALALPSLRVETLTRPLMEAIRRVRKTNFTLAPEAGTQRLRDAINKGNTQADLLATAAQVFDAGWKSLKLYFMLGLPGETPQDHEGIADLAEQVVGETRHRGQVTVSLSTFVPKPHTPFQWARQIGLEETRLGQDYFKRRLRHRRLNVKWHDARMSLLEGIISRGDERTGLLIEKAFEAGCRFDGWSDRFRFDLWEAAMAALAIDPDQELRQRHLTDALPWDPVDCGLGRDFLLREWHRSLQGAATADCREGRCHDCGVCDHRTLRMIIASEDFRQPDNGGVPAVIGTADREAKCGAAPSLLHAIPADGTAPSPPAGPAAHRPTLPAFGDTPDSREQARAEAKTPHPPAAERRLRIGFTKLGPARFLSHLELSAALIRAVHLSGLDFVYSGGFHPLPKISFAFATAVGMESLGEFADIQVGNAPAGDVLQRMNAFLPEGMTVRSIEPVAPGGPSLSESITGFRYHLILPETVRRDRDAAIAAEIEKFLAAEMFVIARRAKDKTIRRNIRPLVRGLRFDPEGRRIELHVACAAAGMVRPTDILSKVLDFDEETLRMVRVLKTETAFAGAGKG